MAHDIAATVFSASEPLALPILHRPEQLCYLAIPIPAPRTSPPGSPGATVPSQSRSGGRIKTWTGLRRKSKAQPVIAEISATIGCSQATLYCYFPSKETLYLEVISDIERREVRPAFVELMSVTEGQGPALTRIGARFFSSMVKPELLASRRMVLSEAWHSDIWRRFYEVVPERGDTYLAAWMLTKMKEGLLRRADEYVVVAYLLAFLQSEIIPRYLYGEANSASWTKI